jgi:hypothetical protein
LISFLSRPWSHFLLLDNTVLKVLLWRDVVRAPRTRCTKLALLHVQCNNQTVKVARHRTLTRTADWNHYGDVQRFTVYVLRFTSDYIRPDLLRNAPLHSYWYHRVVKGQGRKSRNRNCGFTVLQYCGVSMVSYFNIHLHVTYIAAEINIAFHGVLIMSAPCMNPQNL